MNSYLLQYWSPKQRCSDRHLRSICSQFFLIILNTLLWYVPSSPGNNILSNDAVCIQTGMYRRGCTVARQDTKNKDMFLRANHELHLTSDYKKYNWACFWPRYERTLKFRPLQGPVRFINLSNFLYKHLMTSKSPWILPRRIRKIMLGNLSIMLLSATPKNIASWWK